MRTEVHKVRLTILIALLFSALCAGVFRTPPILFMAALLTSAPLVGVLLGRWGNRYLSITRTLPELGTAGDVVTGEISISNRARWPAFLVNALCGFAENKAIVTAGRKRTTVPAVTPVGSDQQVVPMLRGLSRASWQQQWRLQRRGVHELTPAYAGVLDPLGLSSRLPIRTQPQQITVLPRPVRLEQLGVLAGVGQEQQQPHHSTVVADAIDFHGVRPWVPGESIRRAHWKYTARTGELHVIEWEESPASDLALLLDVEAEAIAGNEDENTLETAITAAASIAVYLLEQGCRVQLFYFAPEPGEVQAPVLKMVEAHSVKGTESILRALAEVQPVSGNAAAMRLKEMAMPLVARGLGTLLIASSRADIKEKQHSDLLLIDAESFQATSEPELNPPGQYLTASLRFPNMRRRPSRRAGVPLIRRGEPMAAVLEGNW